MKNKIKNPLESFDHWEDVLLECYSEKNTKTKEEYREYDTFTLTEGVRTFYKLNNQFQAYDFVCQKEKEFLSFKKVKCHCGKQLTF
jgi:inositol oxygenase